MPGLGREAARRKGEERGHNAGEASSSETEAHLRLAGAARPTAAAPIAAPAAPAAVAGTAEEAAHCLRSCGGVAVVHPKVPKSSSLIEDKHCRLSDAAAAAMAEEAVAAATPEAAAAAEAVAGYMTGDPPGAAAASCTAATSAALGAPPPALGAPPALGPPPELELNESPHPTPSPTASTSDIVVHRPPRFPAGTRTESAAMAGASIGPKGDPADTTELRCPRVAKVGVPTVGPSSGETTACTADPRCADAVPKGEALGEPAAKTEMRGAGLASEPEAGVAEQRTRGDLCKTWADADGDAAVSRACASAEDPVPAASLAGGKKVGHADSCSADGNVRCIRAGCVREGAAAAASTPAPPPAMAATPLCWDARAACGGGAADDALAGTEIRRPTMAAPPTPADGRVEEGEEGGEPAAASTA